MYTVRFREVATNQEREKVYEFKWEEGSDFWWSDGNFSCDCNRELEFERAGGHEPKDITKTKCSEGRYKVVWIKTSDGETVYEEK